MSWYPAIFGSRVLRIDVDQLDDPVGIRSRRRREQMRCHVAGDDDVVGQRSRLPTDDVRSILEKTLIVDQPS